MKKTIMTLTFLLIVTIAKAEVYKDALVITTLKKNAEGASLELSLPFRTYSEIIIMNGKNISYRLHDLKNEGKEVLAKVSYRIVDHPSGSLKALDESEVAEAFVGSLGNDWSKIQKDLRYTKHYSVTKEEKLATWDSKGVKTPYAGTDKDDIVKFTLFEDSVANAKEIIE